VKFNPVIPVPTNALSSYVLIADPPPVPPVIVTTAKSPTADTDTPVPVNLIPVAPVTTACPDEFRMLRLPEPQTKYGNEFHSVCPSPILRQSVFVS
jgi:hypothetical protein